MNAELKELLDHICIGLSPIVIGEAIEQPWAPGEAREYVERLAELYKAAVDE